MDDILEEVLAESHRSRMTIHPGGDKMYRDMKRIFYWPGMKRKVAEYVPGCLTCQRVKVEQGNREDYYYRWRYRLGNGSRFRWTLLMGYQGVGRGMNLFGL